MNVGQINSLRILRFTSVGAYLGDEQDNDVLLPNKYLTPEMEMDQDVDVFIYRDSEDRLVATTETPLVKLNGFAFLRIKEVNFYGAFADWGLEKDLLIPFKEQHISLDENKFYLTSLQYDAATDRVYGTTKVNKLFEKCTDDSLINQPLPILIGDQTDLGVKVIVDNAYSGLMYHSDIKKTIRRGDETTGYIYNIREDGKVDVRLEPAGYTKIDDMSQHILDVLQKRKVINLSDKSSPEDIQEALGMSKKAFKQAIGKLYKERLIVINPTSIELV